MAEFGPGWPGLPARWTSSAKSGVGSALSDRSPVWFTISHGILNEIYYPRIDQACTRDFGLVVTDGKTFLSEEKRDARHEIEPKKEQPTRELDPWDRPGARSHEEESGFASGSVLRCGWRQPCVARTGGDGKKL